MNVYITYDRYERDEWYSVYHIETNKQRAIKHFLEVDLLDFVTYGPDDCHSFQLQKVLMPRKDYLKLCKMVEDDSYSEHGELKDMMMNIYNESSEAGYEVENIFFTDGCSDNVEIVKYYCVKNGMDPENSEDFDKAQELLCNNEELYTRVARGYIDANYRAEPYYFLYITYDRYEHDEWFYVYHVSWCEDEALQHCRDVDLVDFISCGPDDCHSFQLQEVGVPNSKGKRIIKLVEKQENDKLTDKEEEELEEFLKSIYHSDEYSEISTIISTDGCSDFTEIVDYYYKNIDKSALCEDYENCDEDELRDLAQEKLLADDELFKKILKEYIDTRY